MTAESFVSLIEEMVDLKVHLVLESQMKPSPEVAKVLSQKRYTDQRRLEQIRAQLAYLIEQTA